MRKIISFRMAFSLSLVLYGLFFVFHILVLIGVIPDNIVWGGRYASAEGSSGISQELMMFEFVSILILVFAAMVAMIKADIIKSSLLKSFSHVTLWILFVLFLLNTVGNFFAETNFEKYFAIITFLLAFLNLRMAIEPKSQTPKDND